MESAVLILGIGNTLLSDEGAGVHAVRRLEAEASLPDVQYLDGGTLSFTLAGAIEDSGRLIVVDAAELGAPPGTVRCFEGGAMDDFLGSSRKRSVHEVSLLDLMAVVLLAGRLPERRALVGCARTGLDHAGFRERMRAVAAHRPGFAPAAWEDMAGRLPERRALVGIQPQNLDWGHEPSSAVQQAIPTACDLVRALIQRWRS